MVMGNITSLLQLLCLWHTSLIEPVFLVVHFWPKRYHTNKMTQHSIISEQHINIIYLRSCYYLTWATSWLPGVKSNVFAPGSSAEILTSTKHASLAILSHKSRVWDINDVNSNEFCNIISLPPSVPVKPETQNYNPSSNFTPNWRNHIVFHKLIFTQHILQSKCP